MSDQIPAPAAGAKYVAALVVVVVGVGAFVGISHDGRGGDAPADPESIVEEPLTSTSLGMTNTTQSAVPATPDAGGTPTRLRSSGS